MNSTGLRRVSHIIASIALLASLSLTMAACSGDPGDGSTDQCAGPYTEVCDGACITTQTNPDHCGGCGIICGESEACFSGQCVDTCSAGLERCDRRCVDFDTDADNCGGCGNACGDQEGCSLGVCVESMAFEREGNLCLAGGPAIVIEDSTSGDRCSGQLRQELFGNALCSCDRAVFEGDLRSDGFDSTLGPYVPGLLAGPVGMNDHLEVSGQAAFDGTVIVAGRLEAEEDLLVTEDLWVGGALAVAGEASIQGDAAIRGSISASALAVDGRLTVPTGTDVDDYEFGELLEEDVIVAPPCPCDSLPNVSAIVAGRRDNNDNAAAGLDANVLVSNASSLRHLALPCGQFFLRGSDMETDLTIVVNGRTAVYIDGTFTSSGDLRILPAPGAELDLFIDGQITAEGTLTLGSPNYPAATRIYIGDQISLQGDVRLNGYLLGEDHISMEGDLEVFGGLFAGNLMSGEGDTWIHYDHQVREATDPELTADTCPALND